MEQRHNGADEGKKDTHNRGGSNGCNRRVFRDSNAANRFAVRRVGANAKKRTGDRAYAVTEQGVFQAGFGDKVFADDVGKVLMVGNVFCENDQSHGQERHDNFYDCAAGELGCAAFRRRENFGREFTTRKLFNRFYKRELGHTDKRRKSLERAVCVYEVVNDGLPVDNFEIINVRNHTDSGENGSDYVACRDTENKGNQTGHSIFLLRGAKNNGCEGNHTAKERDKVIRTECNGAVRFHDVAHCRASQGQTDKGNRRADDNGGHKLGNPVRTDEMNNQSDDYVYETCYDRTENDTAVAVCKRNAQRVQERKGATQENRALKAGKELIHERTNTCTKDSRGDLRGDTDDGGNGDGRREDCQQLLQREKEHIAEFRFVVHVVDEIVCHIQKPPFSFVWILKISIFTILTQYRCKVNGQMKKTLKEILTVFRVCAIMKEKEWTYVLN